MNEDRTAAKEEARGRKEKGRKRGKSEIRERRIAIERALQECKERASTERERGGEGGDEKTGERKKE